MMIPITDKMRVGELQSMFQQSFPFLKLEIFNFPNAWEPGSEDGFNYHPAFRLSKASGKKFKKHLLKIQPWKSTRHLEEKLFDDFGLNAQVYRRFEDHWILTDGSDDVSLAEQNELGQRSAERFFNGSNLWVEREKIL